MAKEQFKVLRPDIERLCNGNQRLIKAFENLFRMLPIDTDPNSEAIEAAQITADNATAQALLAVALIEFLSHITELVSTEPKHVCLCALNEDLSPRFEQVQQDVILPSDQLTEPMNLYLEVN